MESWEGYRQDRKPKQGRGTRRLGEQSLDVSQVIDIFGIILFNFVSAHRAGWRKGRKGKGAWDRYPPHLCPCPFSLTITSRSSHQSNKHFWKVSKLPCNLAVKDFYQLEPEMTSLSRSGVKSMNKHVIQHGVSFRHGTSPPNQTTTPPAIAPPNTTHNAASKGHRFVENRHRGRRTGRTN